MQLYYATLDSTAAVYCLADTITFPLFFVCFSANDRMFSSLKLVVSDLPVRLGAGKVEKIFFLRLNKSSTTFVSGLGKVVRS